MEGLFFFFFQAEDGIRDIGVTGVQTCALPICLSINGKLVDAPSTFDVFNPATDGVIAAAPAASTDQLEQAIAAARAAFPAWSALPWEERSAYVARYADALEAQRD